MENNESTLEKHNPFENNLLLSLIKKLDYNG